MGLVRSYLNMCTVISYQPLFRRLETALIDEFGENTEPSIPVI